jgi:ATP-dependent RNA helicase DeaD
VPTRQEAGRLEPYRTAVADYLTEHHVDPAELAAVLLALAVGDTGATAPVDEAPATGPERPTRDVADRGHRPRSDRPDGDDRPRGPRDGAQRPSARRRVTGTRYRVAVGHTHGARPEAIVGAITGEGGLRGAEVGKIDIFPSFSLVEIATELSTDVSRRIGAAKVAGRPLRIRVDEGPGDQGRRTGDRSFTTPASRPRP